MSVECSGVVWKRNFSGASRKVVAVKLADHADDDGRGIWPSVERIAAQCDISCRTVQRVLADFVREGILKVINEGGMGPGSTRRYDFDMAVVRALPLAVPAPDSAETGRKKGDTVSPLAETKGDTDDAKGDTDDEKGCHGVTQTVIEPPIEPSLERAREREAGEGPSHDDFRKGLRKWPVGIADSEPKALRAWERLTTEERLQALDRQDEYVAAVKATKRTKWVGYDAYLSERRWKRLPERTAGAVKLGLPAYGPAWAAVCMRALLAGPVDTGPPEVTRETRLMAFEGMVKLRGEDWARDYFRRRDCDFADDGSMVFPADFEERQMREHVRRHGYPAVNGLYAAAEAGYGVSGPEAQLGQSLAKLMVFVVADTPPMRAWQDYFEERDWPFPALGYRRGLYFPAGGPEELHAFERAIHDHAA